MTQRTAVSPNLSLVRVGGRFSSGFVNSPLKEMLIADLGIESGEYTTTRCGAIVVILSF